MLEIAICTHKAAQFAVNQWHYSKSLPAGKTYRVGVWEDKVFKGCILYSYGANQHLGKSFNLSMFECVELTRVALAKDRSFKTSQVLAQSLKMLKKDNPKLRLVISYADVDQSHHGGLYQVTNWTYLGLTETDGGTPKYRINGKVTHGRQVYSLYGKGAQNIDWLRENVDPNAEKVFTLGKHKYAYPLDKRIRKVLLELQKSYPKPDILEDVPNGTKIND